MTAWLLIVRLQPSGILETVLKVTILWFVNLCTVSSFFEDDDDERLLDLLLMLLFSGLLKGKELLF